MKIFCIGRNYIEHAKELNNPVPEEPVIFIKPSTAITRIGKPFYYPEFTKMLHYECELVVKFCRNGKHVSKKFAHKYYDQLTIGIDLTARDIQNKCKEKGLPWEIAKGFDGAAVIGDFIEVKRFKNFDQLEFSMKKNNMVVQQGKPEQMLFSIPELIVHISKYFTINKGDLLFTGTPAGVGEANIGDYFEGFVAGEKLLSCKIK